MGFLSKLWKGVKNVFKGVLKIFSPILKPLAKILNSSWGKAIMLAISVFTFGTAFLAAGSAFSGSMAAGQGFVASFVEGGKAFVGSLLGTGQGGGKEGAMGMGEGGTGELAAGSAEAIAEGGNLAQKAITEGVPGAQIGAENLNQATDLVSGGALSNAAADTGTLMSKGGALGPTKAMAETGKSLAKEAGGNWLTKAAKGAWDFAKSDTGQNIIGSALEGYAAGERNDALLRHEKRYDRMWQDPAQTQAITDQKIGFIPDVWNRDPAALANQRNRDYTPSVPYTQAPGS